MFKFYQKRHLAQNRLISIHRWEQLIPFINSKKYAPIVLTIHGSGEFIPIAYRNRWDLKLFHYCMEKWALKYADKIILISQQAFQFYKIHYPKYSYKFLYIPTFVSNKIFNPTPKQDALKQLDMPLIDKPIFLYVGRLVPEKNIIQMIVLFHHYIQKYGESYFWIAGDGPDKNRIISTIEKYNLKYHVRLWGNIPHDKLIYFYNCGSIIFLLSEFEGTPLTLLESQACGIPCIGTPVGELQYIIKNDINGYLIRPESNLEDIIAKMHHIIIHNQEFKNNTLQSIEPYFAERVIPAIIKTYQSIYKEYFNNKNQ